MLPEKTSLPVGEVEEMEQVPGHVEQHVALQHLKVVPDKDVLIINKF